MGGSAHPAPRAQQKLAIAMGAATLRADSELTSSAA